MPWVIEGRAYVETKRRRYEANPKAYIKKVQKSLKYDRTEILSGLDSVYIISTGHGRFVIVLNGAPVAHELK